jgi:hypothetical protein
MLFPIYYALLYQPDAQMDLMKRIVPMNNNLYHWHDEQMVKHEMQEFDHAVEQARLLKEAGLSSPSLLTRVAKALHNLLIARRARARGHKSLEHESYSCLRESESKT